MTKTRRRHSPALKAEIVRRHVAGKEPISNLAEEFNIQPTQIHTWIAQVLSQAEKVFERAADGRGAKQADQAKDQQITHLQAKLAKKDEVIVELMQEHVQLKKAIGEP